MGPPFFVFNIHYRWELVAPMERASVAMDGDSRTAMDGPNYKQSCPLEWVSQALAAKLKSYISNTLQQTA